MTNSTKVLMNLYCDKGGVHLDKGGETMSVRPVLSLDKPSRISIAASSLARVEYLFHGIYIALIYAQRD